MGTLGDAIREHLELKRSQGASEEELGRAESEALGRGRPAVDLSPEKPVEKPTEEPAADHQPSMLEELGTHPAVDDAAPATPLPEELDPDEVLPEEALDPAALTVADRRPAFDEPLSDDDAPLDDGEDVLEETPDFLEETPEHDRLWFEQKPPKDFDFGD